MYIQEKKLDMPSLLAVSVISLLPIIFILGTGLLNFFIILLDVIFLYELFSKKKLKLLNNKFFKSLILFWIILLITLIFSISFIDSISRSFGFIRFILFSFAINYYFFNNQLKNIILKFWTIFFLIISLDLIFEYFFGFNTLGFKSYIPGRLSGFFNQELKIGHLYSAFILITLTSIYMFFKDLNILGKKFFKKIIQKNGFYIFLIIFLFIAFIIGERSNFIKTLIITILFVFLIDNKDFQKKLLSIFAGLIIIGIIIFNHDIYKYRFFLMFIKPIINNPVELVTKSNYGSHYKVAYEVYKNNKITGVGLKNYRIEVMKDKYSKDSSIHPHQVHFEILSETGLIGYISFLSLFIFNLFYSINYFFKKKNYFQLSGTLFVIVSLIPLLPSGSFFTSFGAALFWMNYGLMLPKKDK